MEEGCPVDLDQLQAKRRIQKRYKDNLPSDVEEDDLPRKVGPKNGKG